MHNYGFNNDLYTGAESLNTWVLTQEDIKFIYNHFLCDAKL